MVGVDRVDEALFFAELLPERRAVAVAEHDGEQVEQRRVGVGERDRGPGDGAAGLLDLGGVAAHAGRELGVFGRLIHGGEAAAGRGAEVFLHAGAGGLGGDVAGDDDHEVVGRVAFAVVGEQLVAGDGGEDVAVADDGLAQGMVFEDGAGEGVPVGAVVVVVAHGDLAQDDVAFARDLVGGQRAVQRHVGEQIDGDIEVGGGQVDVIDGAVVGGVGVDRAAVGLDGGGDLAAGAALRALEEQVLEVVGKAGAEEGALVLAAGFHPNLDGDDGRGVVGLDQQHEAVWQLGAVDGLGPEAFEETAVGGGEQRRHRRHAECRMTNVQ